MADSISQAPIPRAPGYLPPAPLIRVTGHGLAFLAKLFPELVIKNTTILAAKATEMTFQMSEKIDAATLEIGLGRVIEATTEVARELVDTTRKEFLEPGEKKVAKSAEGAAKLTSGITILGSMTGGVSAGADLASEASAEVVTPLVDAGMKGAGRITQVAAKPAIKLTSKLADLLLRKGIGGVNRWLSQRFYNLHSNPESVQQTLLNGADRLYRIANTVDFIKQQDLLDTAGIRQGKQELQERLEEPRITAQEFILLPTEQKNMIIALVKSAGKLKGVREELLEAALKASETDKSFEKLSVQNQKVLKNLLKAYESLTPEETKILLKEDFNSFSDIEKNKIFSLVSGEAKLTPAERKYLLTIKETPWNKFGPKETSFLVNKYNTLNVAQQEKFFNLSLEELHKFSEAERKAVISLVTINMLQKEPTDEKLMRIDRLLKAKTINKQDLYFLRACCKEYLSTPEKAAISKLHHENIDVLNVGSDTLTDLIAKLEKHFEKVLSAANTNPSIAKAKEVVKIKSLLSTLKAHQQLLGERVVAAPPAVAIKEEMATSLEPTPPIDLAALHMAISKDITTQGWAAWGGEKVGQAAEYVPWIALRPVSKLFSGLGNYVFTTENFDRLFRHGIPLVATFSPETVAAIATYISPDFMIRGATNLVKTAVWMQDQALEVYKQSVKTLGLVDSFIKSLQPYIESLQKLSHLKDAEQQFKPLEWDRQFSMVYQNTTKTFETSFGAAMKQHEIALPHVGDYYKWVTSHTGILPENPLFRKTCAEMYKPFWNGFAEMLAAHVAHHRRFFAKIANTLNFLAGNPVQVFGKSMPTLGDLAHKADVSARATLALDALRKTYSSRAVTFIPSQNSLREVMQAYQYIKGASRFTLERAEQLEYFMTKLFGISKFELETFNALFSQTKETKDELFTYLSNFLKPAPEKPVEKPAAEPKLETKLKEIAEKEAKSAKASTPAGNWYMGVIPTGRWEIALTGVNLTSFAFDWYQNRMAVRLLGETVKRVSVAASPVLAPLFGNTLGFTSQFISQAAFWLEFGIGATLKAIPTYAGKGIQAGIDQIAGTTIDPKRIANFKKLKAEEVEHLVYLVTTSSKIDSKTKAAIDKTLNPAERAKLVLAVYDLLAPEELLRVSPSLLKGLSYEDKESLIDFVDKRMGLTPLERKSDAAIAEKFNALSRKEAKKMHVLTEDAFYKLSDAEQNDILYMVSHADSYHEKVLGVDLSKLSVSDRIERKRVSFFRLREMITGTELKQVLVTLSELKPDEFHKLTPHSLSELGEEKIPTVLHAVQTYGADTIDKYLKELKNLKSPRARELLVTLYNETLRPHQKSVILDLSVGELKSFEKAQAALQFLIENDPLLPHSDKRELVQATQFSNAQKAKICERFNSLKPSLKQEFAEKEVMKKITEQNSLAAYTHELQEVERRLKKTANRIASIDREITRQTVTPSAERARELKKLEDEKEKLVKRQERFKEALFAIKLGASSLKLREAVFKSEEGITPEIADEVSGKDLEIKLVIERVYHEASQQKGFDKAKHIGLLSTRIAELEEKIKQASQLTELQELENLKALHEMLRARFQAA